MQGMLSRRRVSRSWALFAPLISLAVLLFAGGCGPKYPKCETDDHCAEKGEVCVEGVCQQCRDDSNCGEGQRCAGGRCEEKPECSTNSDCSDNKICRSGRCQIECAADADCGSGLNCKDNRCVDPLACATTSDCEAGMSCISGRCSEPISASRSMGCDYPTVRFPFNEATLSSDAKEGLQAVADCLKSRSGTIVIEGHCDERGTEEYNLALGDRRARAVKQYLNRLGVSNGSLDVVSKGETEPLDPGHNESAWEKNRRAEFIDR